MMGAYRAVLFLAFLSSCLAAKFAMFPMFGRSHFMYVSRLGQELAERGHEVAIFVGASQQYAERNPHVRFFNDSKFISVSTGSQASGEKGKPSFREGLILLYTFQSFYCDDMLSNGELLEETWQADLVVGELLYPCSALVADKLSVPHVLLSPGTLGSGFLLHLPAPPSYVPQFSDFLSNEWSIMDRARNVLQWFSLYLSYSQDMCPVYDKIKTKHNITPNKSIQETLGRADMVIGQMNFGLEHPRPLYPNTRVVGPINASPAKPLPNELEQFMLEAGDKGVILVSFGSVLGPVVGFNESILQIMADAFSKLPQKIIWKVNLQGKSKLSVGDNVKLLPWLPQNDILGHPKTRLFIAHAGINGILESTYHAVPMICSPFFGDQFYNAFIVKQAGVGEMINLESATSEQLVGLIRKVLSDPSYRESALRISNSIKLLPRPPVKEAADWVEYTQALGGLQFLRPRSLDMPFYQIYLIDIFLLAIVILVVILFAVGFLLKTVIRRATGSTKKEKEN